MMRRQRETTPRWPGEPSAKTTTCRRMDDIWNTAAERAENAERESGMTPFRRCVARLFTGPLAAVIQAHIGAKAHLPHGRLGVLLQAAEPRALAIMALEAVIPQLGRPRRRKARYEFERDLKLAIGEIFYANVTMAKAAEDADKDARRRLRWQRFALQGKLKVRRHETPGKWLTRLRREREIIWWALTKDVSRDEILRAGSWLLARVMEAGIVRLVGNNLVSAPGREEELRRIQYIILRANVRLLPPAEKPVHWTGPEIYRSGLKVKFLHHWNPAHQDSIAASFHSSRFQRRHLAAVNILGDVPLCIDEWTLKLVEDFAAEVRGHKDAERRLAYAQQVARDVNTAGILLRRGPFHNSYHIDSRGRVYGDQGFNYAQRDDIRSLYRFAHGADVGRQGLRWLMINAADTAGQDKLSFDDRVKWADVNYDAIERVAKDPRGTFDAWRDVASPFAFVSACRELVLVANDTKYLSDLPIAFDHSASGIQHLCLVGLDAATAPLVNLIDCKAPRDIYGELARRTVELFDSSPWAGFWSERFSEFGASKTRKLLKVPGLTFSYSSTDRGNVGQIFHAYDEIYGSELDDELGDDAFKAVVYLVGQVSPSLRGNVTRSRSHNERHTSADAGGQPRRPLFGVDDFQWPSSLEQLPKTSHADHLPA